MESLAGWQREHRLVIQRFLYHLNQQSDRFILKDGTALMECYGLDRFSEDIDFDGLDANIFQLVDGFCKLCGYDYRIAKDTELVRRCMIHYGNQSHPLKVEVSYRRESIVPIEVTSVKRIKVYTIQRLASLKCMAYIGRDRIRDLYDLCFICNRYHDELPKDVLLQMTDGLQAKGLEYFDYISSTQKDELINIDALETSFLQTLDRLGILWETEEPRQRTEKMERELPVGQAGATPRYIVQDTGPSL